MEIITLIEGCIKGDRRAQHELFYTYSKQLMAVAYRYSKDESSAKDIVQESYITIYKSIKQLKNKSENSLVAWMKKITIRHALRSIEKNKSFQNKKQIETRKSINSSSNLELSDALNILSSLPEGYRQVFQLYVIEGYSHKEIGQLLQIGISSSRSQLTRARALFNKKWSQTENYYGK